METTDTMEICPSSRLRRRPFAARTALFAALWAAMAAAPLLAASPEPRIRTLRTWEDTVKQDGRDVARRVEILFDYDRAVGLERIYDGKGALVSERTLEQAPPRPSAEEFREAIAIVEKDPEIGAVAKRTGAIFEGGFLMEGGPAPCGDRTRCVEVQLLDTNRYAAIRKVVVDLVSRTIAIRVYAGGQALSGEGTSAPGAPPAADGGGAR